MPRALLAGVGAGGARRACGCRRRSRRLTPRRRLGASSAEPDRSRSAARPARAFASRTRPWLSYDIAGKGFTSFRGVIGLENPPAEIGSTLDPQIRFFVFDAPPDMDRLDSATRRRFHCRRRPRSARCPRRSTVCSATLSGALRRQASAPSPKRRFVTRRAELVHPPQGLADLLWAVTMKPEFQLIY